jgi:LysM repeat protein
VLALVVFAVLAILLLSAATTEAAPAQACGTYHLVQRGETMSSISRQYGVPIPALMRANPRVPNPNLIFAGTWLFIPCQGSGGPGTGGMCRAVHRVSFGQTLNQIALWYHVSPNAIASTNNIQNMNRIYAGQSLCIP